jgi:hypothetical protein
MILARHTAILQVEPNFGNKEGQLEIQCNHVGFINTDEQSTQGIRRKLLYLIMGADNL